MEKKVMQLVFVFLVDMVIIKSIQVKILWVGGVTDLLHLTIGTEIVLVEGGISWR
tara:strand:+ start:79 stop:243 length:165 start_codon:yes stop_codon:yes gene_type:complete